MCAPMRTTEEILGVLYVDSQMAREFNEAELELLAAVGNQAGIALHRARLMLRGFLQHAVARVRSTGELK